MAASAAFIDVDHFETADLIAQALARIKQIEPIM
jgi:hypothetical protein